MNAVTCFGCACGRGTKTNPKCILIRPRETAADGRCPYYTPKREPKHKWQERHWEDDAPRPTAPDDEQDDERGDD